MKQMTKYIIRTTWFILIIDSAIEKFVTSLELRNHASKVKIANTFMLTQIKKFRLFVNNMINNKCF